MAKKKNISTLLVFFVFALSVVAVIHTTTKPSAKEVIAYINDGWVSWDEVTEIKISADGYYGRDIDEPIVINDASQIKKIVKKATNASKYEQIPTDEYLEGMCSIFVDFGNGCVISLYEGENYGTIGNEITFTSAKEGYFKFPNDFYEYVKEILETNAPSK